jgi:gas vesicle protein
MRNETGTTTGAGGLFLGILIGALVGGTVALLFAPRSGKETREMMRNKATETQEMIKNRVNDVKDKFGRVKENIRSSAEQEMKSID